jgi:UDP-N-acetylmuramoyl-tripeptide--D-alanyl-D-alanine ligase
MTLDAITIIDDAFNANPLSMKLALDVLAESASPGQRRVAILGTMRELGSQTVMYHEEIGTYARSRADLILGVGEHAEHYSDRHVFPDSDACATALRDLLRPGDIVLIKGSAAVQLVRVVKALKGLAFV